MPKISDQHRSERRQRILDAAIACFARRGIHQTSMADIFQEAGMSAGSVYLYFNSKESILEAIAEARHSRESSLIERALRGSDARAVLHDLADAYFSWFADPDEMTRRRAALQVWSEAAHNERLREIVQVGSNQRLAIVGLLDRARTLRQLDPELEADAVSRVCLALLQGFLLQQCWEPDLDIGPYAAVVHALVDSLLHEAADPE